MTMSQEAGYALRYGAASALSRPHTNLDHSDSEVNVQLAKALGVGANLEVLGRGGREG